MVFDINETNKIVLYGANLILELKSKFDTYEILK